MCAWKTGQYRQCLTTSRLLCGAETAVTVRAVGRELSRQPVRLLLGWNVFVRWKWITAANKS